ncbi:DUF1028 domain-containing protein [Microvirga antarctica]|uniref:DUF1028 domain-containing protein n=1 Tax=Microvirga antarctica TaxID=2819233 RepID=UPI001B30F23D|nr:DUF1028 domain-containing protein [Microvirga antarctica]
MTWSIVARDKRTGHLGIAVSTCAFAVGARVPFVETGTGAVATQAFVNPFYGLRGLELLRAGFSAEDVIERITEADAGRAQRQVHVTDRAGRFAAYTGMECVPWCGHLLDETFSVAGNMLANEDVVPETARAFRELEALPLARRLVAALKAGEAAGGDKRGRQSAALVVHDSEEYPLVDLRVDDHADPLAELERLEAVSRQRFLHYRKFMPSRAHPAGIIDRAEIESRIAQSIANGEP